MAPNPARKELAVLMTKFYLPPPSLLGFDTEFI